MSINLIEKLKSGYIPHNETYEIFCGTLIGATSAKNRLLKYLAKHIDIRFIHAYSIPAFISIPMMGLNIFFPNPNQCFDFLIGTDRISLNHSTFCEIMDYLEKRDEEGVIKDGRSKELSDV